MKSYEKILQDIDKRKLASVYLLDGEEPFFIDRILEKIERIIPEEEKDFNLITLYGKDSSWQDVVNAARQFPMFGERIFVFLRGAGELKNLDQLSGYISEPQLSTTLVIEHRFKKMDGRLKFPKIVANKGVYFTSSKIKEWQVPEWIMGFCTVHNSKIEQEEAKTLATYLGDDLQKIVNELEKIWLNEKEGRDITSQKIEKYIGINRDFNILELPQTLFESNITRLANMLNYFSANPKAAPMPAIIGVFYSFLQKVYLAQYVSPNYTKDRQLGIWKNHRKTGSRFSPVQIHRCIAVLEEFSHKSVGIDSDNKEDILREMAGKIQVVLQ